jgi:hypothetical protein
MDRNSARKPNRFILSNVIAQCKKPTTQTAHLVFADTQANAEKTKRAVFFPTHERKIKINYYI